MSDVSNYTSQSQPTINKYNEIALAGKYPFYRLNQRERKALQTAEEYSPLTPGNWGSTPPITLSAALDALAASVSPSAFGQITVSAVYDFSVNGGAVGTIDLGVQLPANAVIVEVNRDELVTCTSTGSTGTIELKLATDGNIEQTALAADGTNHGVANSGGTSLPKKTTVAEDLQVTIAVSAVTAGRVRYFVRYYISQ